MNYSFGTFMKKLFAPLKGHPRLWIELVIGALLSSVNVYGAVFLMQYMVKQMESGNFPQFQFGLLVIVVFYVLLQLLGYFFRYAGWVGFVFKFRKILHKIIIPKYLNIDNTYTEKTGTGKTISIIDKGIGSWIDAVMESIKYGIAFLFAIMFGLYFIIKIYWGYAILYVVVLALVFFFVSYINQYVLLYRIKRRDYMNAWTQKLVKIIMSKFEILLSNKTAHEVVMLDYDMDQAHYYNKKQGDRQHWIYNVPRLAIVIFRIVAYFTVGYAYFNGDYSLADFTALMGLLMVFDKTISDVVDFYKDFTKKTVEITRLRDLLDTTPQMVGYDQGEKFVYRNGDIRLNSISFAYSEGKPVFDCFSLHIQGGKKTALVGLSGSGKTTLMKLIAGYMRADSGEVLVDGQSIDSVSLQSYFAHIGYLTQEPSVFDGTIRENLMYGTSPSFPLPAKAGYLLSDKSRIGQRDDHKTLSKGSDIIEGDSIGAEPSLRGEGGEAGGGIDDLLAQAIHLAHCDFVYDLPDGLDTEIGEKGIRLSGGQRQRLAIAKIFLKNPQIILLDEPTSALDSLSEKLVSDAFHKLFEGRTVIIIAHRLQTVKEADEIIVLGQKNGKAEKLKGGKEPESHSATFVLEKGTHAELSTAGGTYQEMLELQSGFNF